MWLSPVLTVGNALKQIKKAYFRNNFFENTLFTCLPECECALHLADVVIENGLRAEALRQVEAVLDLERLAEGTLLSAGAHDTGGDARGVAGLDGRVRDLARDALLPELQVGRGQGRAGDARVQERVGDVERGALFGDFC